MSSDSPTRVRYGVLAFACTLSMITYLDRVCFGATAKDVASALHLSGGADDLYWAFTAFAFAYAAFEVPSGWLGDVFGPRSALIRIVIWWSFFTALTGLVGLSIGPVQFGYWTLVAIRFLFGMGEAGAYPNITRALHNWFPLHQRGMAQGMVWMSGRLMGGLTPLLLVLLLHGVTYTPNQETTANHAQASDKQENREVGKEQEKNNSKPNSKEDSSNAAQGEGQPTENKRVTVIPPLLHWRGTYFFFGALGIGWCVLFALWFRNRPDQHPSVNEAEKQLILAGRGDAEASHVHVPWGTIFSNRNLWFLCLMYFCAAYGWYFNITYLPSYLENQFNVAKDSYLGAAYKGGPLWLGALGCLIGGYLTDWYIRRTGDRRLGRRIFGIVGHALCALCYFSSLFANSAFTFFLAISLAAFCNDLTMGAAWATCQDIGRRYAAIVAGCMNTIGNLGGAAAGYLTGVIVKSYTHAYELQNTAAIAGMSDVERTKFLQTAAQKGYEVNFIIFGCIYLVAVCLWLMIDASKPVVPDAEEAQAE